MLIGSGIVEQNYVSGAVSLVTNQSLLLEVIVLGSLISMVDSLHNREILMREMKTCITLTTITSENGKIDGNGIWGWNK